MRHKIPNRRSVGAFLMQESKLIKYHGGRHAEIPDFVTEIGDHAFYRHKELQSITIPESVTHIGNNAFEECVSLTSLRIPKGVTCIAHEAFANCTALMSVTIPESVTKIGYDSFWGCTVLTSITVRDIRLDKAAIRELCKEWCIDPGCIIPDMVTSPESPRIIWAVFKTCPEDQRNTAYIREHLADMLCYLIHWKKTEILQTVLQSGIFADLLPDCIDTCIDYAIEEKLFDIQLFLTNYKHEHIGYTDATDQFTL